MAHDPVLSAQAAAGRYASTTDSHRSRREVLGWQAFNMAAPVLITTGVTGAVVSAPTSRLRERLGVIRAIGLPVVDVGGECAVEV